VNAGQMKVENDVYLTTDLGIRKGIVPNRDKRDKPEHFGNCPGAEAGIAGTSGTSP